MQGCRCLHGVVMALGAFIPLCALSSGAASADNPYDGIVARNVFALKPPPAPATIEEAKPPPPKIFLTGITTILGKKQALLKSPPPPAKPGQPPPTELSYILTEGQREGDIEVVAIDEKAGTVKVLNSGTLFVLNFEKDGQKLSPSTAPGALAPGIPAPGGVAPPSVNPYAPGSGFNLPNRPLRAGPGAAVNPQSGIPSSAGGFGTPSTPGGLSYGSSVQPTGGTGVPGSDPASLAAAIQRTPEENVALYEANRLKNEALIESGVKLPRLPRHAYLGGSDQPAAAQQPVQQAPSLPFAPGVQQLPPTQ